MSTIELKNKLKEKIDSLEEKYLLEQILDLIEIETSDKVFEIPENHMADIETGLSQIQDGETISNDEVHKNIKKWLEK